MGIKLITGVSGDRHITPEDDAALHRAAVGSGAFFLTVPTFKIVNNNEITLEPCELLINGRHVRITTPETIKIENGEIGNNRTDCICVKHTKHKQIESVEIAVLKNAITGADINNFGIAPISTAAIAKAKLEGINLTSVSAIPDTIRGLEAIQKLLSEVDHLKAVQENLEKYPKKIYAGNAQMNGDETKTFSEEDLKNAPTGLQLVFCPYANGASLNRNFQSFIVNKKVIEDNQGAGHEFWLNNGEGWTERYVQIFSDKIKGHSTNTKGNWVLRYMYLI